MVKKLVLIGGGGHCKSVLDAALCMEKWQEIVITDKDIEPGTKVMGSKVIGDDEMLQDLFEDGFRDAFITIGSMEDTTLRHSLFRKAREIGFSFPNIIDPSAIVSKTVTLGKGIFVGKKAVINSDASVGDMAIINTGAIVEHDCRIGSYSHIAPGAVLCGGVKVESDSFVGSNATVKQGVNIGVKCVIGAGALVLKDASKGEKVLNVWNGR